MENTTDKSYRLSKVFNLMTRNEYQSSISFLKYNGLIKFYFDYYKTRKRRMVRYVDILDLYQTINKLCECDDKNIAFQKRVALIKKHLDIFMQRHELQN